MTPGGPDMRWQQGRLALAYQGNTPYASEHDMAAARGWRRIQLRLSSCNRARQTAWLANRLLHASPYPFSRVPVMSQCKISARDLWLLPRTSSLKGQSVLQL